MEFREWAEQIVTATSLEEKLVQPGHLTDERPCPTRPCPEMPGRPAELRFKDAKCRVSDFSRLKRIESDADRGRLLHFFANHELLATELMALVLLRFPEAPAAFRRGVARTLLDEQEHTRWYVERMRELGIQFGELAVSGYIWRSVSTMESPLDFVARLSLTFEQANLDYCRQFSEIFESAGDRTTAVLLGKIYRDEIGHVAHGLKWLRRWKRPEETDWDAFCRQLKFPLSPARAKGVPFNVEGRRAAGLTADFIDALKVAAQSRGRTPTVWWFNPLAEGYVAQGRAFTAGKPQAIMSRDLANLPQFMARSDDVVLTACRPRIEFLSQLQEVGFEIPEFIEVGNGGPPWVEKLAGRKLGALRPWAWSPDSFEFFAPLVRSLTPVASLRPEGIRGWQALYSKVWSAEFFRRLLPEWTKVPGICPAEMAGIAVRNWAEAMETIRSIRGGGHHRIVVKQAIGLAGDQALRLWEPDILPAQRRWMERSFDAGQTLVVEPWLERLVDFSMQLEMTRDGLKLIGYPGLMSDLRGQYKGNWAEPKSSRCLPAAVRRWGREIGVESAVWEGVFLALKEALEVEFRTLGYYGPAGVDAFVYRNSTGEPRLKPLVELNPRCTMGRLTLELMRYVAPGAVATFRLRRLTQIQREGFRDFVDYAQHLSQQRPLSWRGNPERRISDGIVLLNDPRIAERVLAVWEVGARMNHPAASTDGTSPPNSTIGAG